MERLLRTFFDYYRQKEFLKFQNDFAQELYDSLGKSYSNGLGEVKIVTELCNVVDDKKYENLKFSAKKIHGKRSYVEFDNKDKPTTKELADMVIISTVTRNRHIIFEKIAFVQNKKETKENIWDIDQDQLYLLHNFPTLKGKTGLLKGFCGTDDIIFSNQSETLGNYGLFQNPGEMILINALSVYKIQKNDKIIFNDLKQYPYDITKNKYFIPFFSSFEMDLYRFFKHCPECLQIFLNYSYPFLNNSPVSYNIRDFIRNWSLFNIGEIVVADGETINQDLFTLSKSFLRNVMSNEDINLSVENHEQYKDFTDMAVLAAHLDLGKK
jgi:hypothetical protein